jgi:selenium metabolism protein YedF
MIMTREIDCRKLNCPVPVINTKKVLDEGEDDSLIVVVDNIPARDNVRRFANSQGHKVEIEDKGGGVYNLKIAVNPEAKKTTASGSPAVSISPIGGFVVFITTDQLGVGEERLGQILMKAFLNTLGDSEPKPERIIFINNGVKLVVEGSEMLDSLKALKEHGVQIFACGTCLNYYGILDKLQIGIVSNMYEIVNFLLDAPKVIKI